MSLVFLSVASIYSPNILPLYGKCIQITKILNKLETGKVTSFFYDPKSMRHTAARVQCSLNV
jgi:hypothetical protein